MLISDSSFLASFIILTNELRVIRASCFLIFPMILIVFLLFYHYMTDLFRKNDKRSLLIKYLVIRRKFKKTTHFVTVVFISLILFMGLYTIFIWNRINNISEQTIIIYEKIFMGDLDEESIDEMSDSYGNKKIIENLQELEKTTPD